MLSRVRILVEYSGDLLVEHPHGMGRAELEAHVRAIAARHPAPLSGMRRGRVAVAADPTSRDGAPALVVVEADSPSQERP